ncbi:MAG TPA: tRNA pseudouridine(55) synthase TruB [Pyrinomonadaceae bacterium]|nr:tRNA pseudouridine(55) synthase TruB [Pyrinomonadaceae bacterium]
MDGILIIDKPTDWTSHDVVGKLRKILKTKRIGHTGTLDPFATGVLVMLVGQATRLAQFLDKDAKEYEAVVQLGFETDTGDLTGERRDGEMARQGDSVMESEIEQVLESFRGQIEQIPPMYSAKKVDGKKLYELARKGIEIERKAVAVTIYELELLEEIPNPKSQIRIRVLCTAGTYIRTLAEDIGRKLGTGAHLTALRRTRAGNFDLTKAVSIEQLQEIVLAEKLDDYLIPMNQAVSHLPEVKLSDEEVKKIRNGMKLPSNLNAELVRLTDSENNLIAIGSAHENFIRPKIVFV